MDKYEIAFAADAWDKWWRYCNMMKGEVGCFGYVTLHPDLKLAYVDDLFLVPQEASAAEVDFVKDGLPYAVEKAVADDRLDDLRFCIHSHGDIGTMWSGTDEQMIATMGENADWFVSCVTNRKGSMRGRIDVFRFEPLGDMHIKFDELRMFRYVDPTLEAATQAELDQFVSKPAPQAKKPKALGSGGGKPGKPFTTHDNKIKFWDGHKLQTLTDEGYDIYSYQDGGVTMYIDDDGEPIGFATTGESDWFGAGPGAPYPAVDWDDQATYPSDGEGWVKVGEDRVVVDPNGKPIFDKYGCCITDVDLDHWDLEDLLHADDLRQWKSYLEARADEVVLQGVQS